MSSSASASSQSEPVVVTATRDAETTRHVSHRDLNLLSLAGQRQLGQRVDYAIKDVCAIGEYYAKRTLAASMDYQACSDVAWNGARPQIAAAIGRAMAGIDAGGNEVASTAIVVSARAKG
jgi:UrcA family protein